MSDLCQARKGWIGTCRKKAKHDPDENGKPTRCGTHSKAAKQKRQKRKDEDYIRWKNEIDYKRRVSEAKDDVLYALRIIAEGYNDPVTLARAVISRHDAVLAEQEKK